MTEEEKKDLAAEIAGELEDSCGIETEGDRDLTARCIVDRIEHELKQLGWMPPAKTDRIHSRIRAWCVDMAKLPDHPVTRQVLNSQMAELAQILADR